MNYALWNLFGPASAPFWLILFAALSLLLKANRAARVAVYGAALFVLLTAILPTGFVLLRSLEDDFPMTASVPSDIEHIVVLAGAERLRASTASGRLEVNGHAERISEPLALARLLPAAKLWIVGGVSRGGTRRDVDWTAAYWERAGIPRTRIGKIGGTLDTCGNADGIARALPGRRVLVVTSGFHMPRTMACMARAGVDAVPFPVDRQTWDASNPAAAFTTDLAGNAERAALALHEYMGLVYYRVAGRI